MTVMEVATGAALAVSIKLTGRASRTGHGGGEGFGAGDRAERRVDRSETGGIGRGGGRANAGRARCCPVNGNTGDRIAVLVGELHEQRVE